ncbi:hypothetical protein [Anaeromicrobium sediminis]|uniref:Uncharacterized protein n=1 Tax=Anaeromicrobium sediminis TaxID=1478221 RepID=A0A267MQA2_9FIRM|nr:hypothetical protein [Anaeromicrobium sediminis]PAB61078.1 hypothetical protein CCE28_01225 [Anaeromicrobium sediminis]
MALKKSIIVFIILLMGSIAITNYNGDANSQVYGSEDSCKSLKERLKSLEPAIPQNMDDPPFFEYPLPRKVYSITEVIEKGHELNLRLAYNNPKWERQAYKEYWYSKYGRWSYVPIRIHYAMHRLFTTYTTASVNYDFVHELGITEESHKFPVLDNPLTFIRTVVMKSKVLKIITYGNQVIIIAKPQRYGLQVYDIPTKQINPINSKEPILFQLVTEQGDEIDYELIDYVYKPFF